MNTIFLLTLFLISGATGIIVDRGLKKYKTQQRIKQQIQDQQDLIQLENKIKAIVDQKLQEILKEK